MLFRINTAVWLFWQHFGTCAVAILKTRTNMPAKQSITEQLIAEIAHKLWVDAGHPDGQADDHWFKALEIAHAKKVVAAKKVAAKAEADSKPVAKKAAAKKAA
jgi:Protein of unknown function (DUF2934)